MSVKTRRINLIVLILLAIVVGVLFAIFRPPDSEHMDTAYRTGYVLGSIVTMVILFPVVSIVISFILTMLYNKTVLLRQPEKQLSFSYVVVWIVFVIMTIGLFYGIWVQGH